jgi:hypothetical protein
MLVTNVGGDPMGAAHLRCPLAGAEGEGCKRRIWALGSGFVHVPGTAG